jgi:hypothetical protein
MLLVSELASMYDVVLSWSLPKPVPRQAAAKRQGPPSGFHHIPMRVRQPVHRVVSRVSQYHEPIQPEFEVQLPKNVPFLTRNIVMNLQGLRFPQAGIYSIDIGCDGEVLVRLPLRIVQVTQGANGETKMA